MPSALLWTEGDKAHPDRPAGRLPSLVTVIDLSVSSRAGTEVLLLLGPQERLLNGDLTISSSNQEEEVDNHRIQSDVTLINDAPLPEEKAALAPRDEFKQKISRPTGTNIGWFTVDLEDRRQLVGIYVPTTSAHPTAIGALKLGDGGPWFPATPVDTVALNERVAFPPMTTQRLMVVFGSTDTNGRFIPATVAVKATELAVIVAQPPSDLAVSAGSGPPFFARPGLFPYIPGDLNDTAEGTAAPGFAAAVNAARREQTEGTELPLRLTASTGGTVNLRLANAVIGAFLPDRALPSLTVPVPRDGPAQVRLPVGVGRSIGALSLRLAHQPETQQIASPPITVGPRLAVVSGDGAPVHQLYQGLVADPGLALTGAEPRITVHRAGTLTLTLYTDDDGTPGLPLAAVSLPVAVGDRQQVTLALPGALLVPPRFFVGLSTTDAELWVALGTPAGAGHPLRPTQSLRRTGAGPALPLSGAIEARFLRQSPEAAPTSRLTLRRGRAEFALSVDRDQRLDLSQPLIGEPSLAGGGAILDALNAELSDPWLTIELVSPYAGTLDLRPLRLLVGPATTAALSA